MGNQQSQNQDFHDFKCVNCKSYAFIKKTTNLNPYNQPQFKCLLCKTNFIYKNENIEKLNFKKK